MPLKTIVVYRFSLGIFMNISPTKTDVIWGYIGIVFNYCGSLLLIPILTAFLSTDDLGLWYVLLAVSNLAQLFELGFNPAFSRNIIYCLSGAKQLSSKERIVASSSEIDWHLYRTLTKASRVLYACISIVVLAGLLLIGTPYISFITHGFSDPAHFLVWGFFAASIFLNLYYLYALSNLTGLGDVAGENRAKTFSGIVKLGVTVILLLAGFGLIAAALGFLAQGISLRIAAIRCIKKHTEIAKAASCDQSVVTLDEVRDVIKDIAPIAWRTGVEQIALFAASQGASLICSFNLSLSETARYSLGLQLTNAVATVSYAYIRTYYPAYQSSYVSGDLMKQREIVQRGISIYWISEILLTLGASFVGLPVLSIIKSSSIPSTSLFLITSVYIALLNHHTVFCNLILSTNRIPFVKSYIVSSIAGVLLAAILSSGSMLGAYGIALGQMFPQLIYNNWRWPRFVLKELDINMSLVIKTGCLYWVSKLRRLL